MTRLEKRVADLERRVLILEKAEAPRPEIVGDERMNGDWDAIFREGLRRREVAER